MILVGIHERHLAHSSQLKAQAESSQLKAQKLSENILATFPPCQARLALTAAGGVRGLFLRARGGSSAGAGRAALRAGRARDVRARRLGDADARRPHVV